MYNVFYTKDKRIFIIPNHYGHSLRVVKDILNFARTVLEVEIPEDDKIDIQVLAGPRWKGILSIEFTVPELTNTLTAYREAMFLSRSSGLWEWLKY